MNVRTPGLLYAAMHRFRLFMPYLVLAILVPGGSVLTVLLWLQVISGKGLK